MRLPQTGNSTMTCILHKMLKPSVHNYKFFFQEDNRSAFEWKKVKGRKTYLHQITMGECKTQERQHQNEDFKTFSEKVHLTMVSNCIHFLLRINSNFCHFLLKETVQHWAERVDKGIPTPSLTTTVFPRLFLIHNEQSAFHTTLEPIIWSWATCKPNNAKKVHFEESWLNTIISRILMY